jgi:hypothetical protein
MTTAYRQHPASSLGRILQIVLAVTGGLTLVLSVWISTRLRTGTFIMHVAPPERPLGRTTWTGTSLHGAFAWLSAVALATELVWLIWQYQATANLWARGYGGLTIRPGWAVGWWLIPFASLAMPCVAMLELDRRSTPDGNPRNASALLGLWWAAWLAAGFVPLVGAVVSVVPHLESFGRAIDEQARDVDFSSLAHAVAPWFAVAGVLRGLAAALAIMVVRRIDLAQRAMMQTPSAAWSAVPARPDALGGVV